MITMKVGDKYVVNLTVADTVTLHLKLGTFATIDEEALLKVLEYLGSRVPVERRDGRVIS
jgi:hypothetical protein